MCERGEHYVVKGKRLFSRTRLHLSTGSGSLTTPNIHANEILPFQFCSLKKLPRFPSLPPQGASSPARLVGGATGDGRHAWQRPPWEGPGHRWPEAQPFFLLSSGRGGVEAGLRLPQPNPLQQAVLTAGPCRPDSRQQTTTPPKGSLSRGPGGGKKSPFEFASKKKATATQSKMPLKGGVYSEEQVGAGAMGEGPTTGGLGQRCPGPSPAKGTTCWLDRGPPGSTAQVEPNLYFWLSPMAPGHAHMLGKFLYFLGSFTSI